MNQPQPSVSTTGFEVDLNGVCALADLGVVRAAGEDAEKFLHNQLTQDFSALSDSQARLAALCTAKGRMQASFVGFRHSPGDILLVCSRDILAPTLKRLSMFVLRAKVKLSDASADFSIRGLAGAAVAQNMQGGAAPEPWALVRAGAASIVGLYPAQGRVPRALWIAPAGEAGPDGEPLSPDLWHWGEVTSGVATITQAVAEAFVPQMLNYESVGGVNFKKGCYPGQEVVARSQFRGTLKRRAFIVHSETAPLAAGDEVFHRGEASGEPAEPCGLVVQAAPAPGGGFEAIVSMQIAASQRGELRARTPDGPVLSLRPLPYELLADL